MERDSKATQVTFSKCFLVKAFSQDGHARSSVSSGSSYFPAALLYLSRLCANVCLRLNMVRRFSNRICASGAAIFISLMGLTEALDRLLEEWKLRCGC